MDFYRSSCWLQLSWADGIFLLMGGGGGGGAGGQYLSPPVHPFVPFVPFPELSPALFLLTWLCCYIKLHVLSYFRMIDVSRMPFIDIKKV